MFLTTAVDDTNLGTIRRSIFFYASLIASTFYFDLSIDLSKLPGGFIATNDFGISAKGICAIALTLQCYLMLRLWVNMPIAFAKLNRAWGKDEIQKSDTLDLNLTSLVSNIQNVRNEPNPGTLGVSDFSKNLSELLTSLATTHDQISKQEGAYDLYRSQVEAISKTQSTLQPEFRSIMEKLKKTSRRSHQEIMNDAFLEGEAHISSDGSISEGATEASVWPRFNRYIQLARNTALSEDFLGKIETQNENISNLILSKESSIEQMQKQIEKMEAFENYCINFPQSPAGQVIDELVDSLKSELTAARKKRQKEFFRFEVCFPLIIGFASLVLAALTFFGLNQVIMNWIADYLHPNNTTDNLFTAISEASSALLSTTINIVASPVGETMQFLKQAHSLFSV